MVLGSIPEGTDYGTDHGMAMYFFVSVL